MNGIPLASSTSAWALTSSGTSGFSSIPARNDEVRPAISKDPARAVPSEAPRLVAVFCSPPTCSLSLSGTADTVTAPSWEASAPIPKPASSSGTVTISAPASTSMLVSRATIPANIASSPIWTTRRGDACGKNFGMPAAARSSVIDSGMIRRPVSIADRPRATER